MDLVADDIDRFEFPHGWEWPDFLVEFKPATSHILCGSTAPAAFVADCLQYTGVRLLP